MVIITPAIQVIALDEATNPASAVAAQTSGLGIACPNGMAVQNEVVLPPSTVALALPFPIGVTTALVIYIAGLTTVDLVVNVGASNPVALSVPRGLGQPFYNIAKTAVSVSSALGGKIQYVIGG